MATTADEVNHRGGRQQLHRFPGEPSPRGAPHAPPTAVRGPICSGPRDPPPQPSNAASCPSPLHQILTRTPFPVMCSNLACLRSSPLQFKAKGNAALSVRQKRSLLTVPPRQRLVLVSIVEFFSVTRHPLSTSLFLAAPSLVKSRWSRLSHNFAVLVDHSPLALTPLPVPRSFLLAPPGQELPRGHCHVRAAEL